MQIKTILMAIGALWLFIATVVGGALYQASADIHAASTKGHLADRIQRAVFELNILSGDYLQYPSVRAQTQLDQKVEGLGRTLTSSGVVFEKERREFGILGNGYEAIRSVLDRLTSDTADPAAGTPLSSAAVERLRNRLRLVSQTMASTGFQLVERAEKERAMAVDDASRLAGLLFGITAIFLVGTAVVFASRVIRPLGRLRDGIESYGRGDTESRIRATRKDEIGAVAAAFDTMADRLGETTVSRDALAREVEHRRKAEDELARNVIQLEAANKEMEAFTYSVSHDLRAPLRALDGFSAALLEDYGDKLDGEAKTYLGYLREGSQEMAGLIDDLLRLSRLTRGDLVIAITNLSEMVAKVEKELRDAEPGRDVAFDIASDVVVRGDARLLRQVIENLAANAWKFTRGRTDARIDFGAVENGGTTVCHVRDNGAGFNMAYADKLFTPFQRLHGADEFEGTGIGLSTVERIIHRHGGRVWAEGAVGKGATFYFELETGKSSA